MNPMNRRTLLRGAGGVVLALPFLDAMRPTRAAAAEGDTRRLIFSFKANGDEVDKRFVSQGLDDFELGEFLSPLEKYRKDALFLHRLNKRWMDMPDVERGDNHQCGGNSLAPWVFGEGDFPLGGIDRHVGYVLGPSADFAIGQRVLEENVAVPYRHLVYRVGDGHNDIWNLSSHAGPIGQKNPVIPETDPVVSYNRLFSTVSDNESEAAALHRLEMQKSVLDLVGGQVKQLQGKVSYEDRQRLELHSEALRDLERTLSAGVNGAHCMPMEPGIDGSALDPEAHVRVAEAFFKMMVMAFSCDLSRVVNFNWSGNTNDRVYRNLGLEEGHHTISHQSDDEAFAKIRQIHKHLWTNTTTLYEELMAAPDGEGTLWDSTLIVHWNELGQGDSHSLNDGLVVLNGGASGAIRKNQLINLENGGSFPDLLTSCFHYMGFDDVESFGDPRLSQASGGMSDIWV
jgi:Protein of unknown function (DUF1552)